MNVIDGVNIVFNEISTCLKRVNDKSLVKEMTVKQFEQVIMWYMKSYTVRHDDIRLLGGEPLLHSNLDALMIIVLSAYWWYGYKVKNV